MFTGTIEATAIIQSISRHGSDHVYRIERPDCFDDLSIGCSIACNGICLTVTAVDDRSFSVGIMNETLQKTTARAWRTGSFLNLERALKIGGRLDGHLVLGHIDTTLVMIKCTLKSNTRYMNFGLPKQFIQLVVPQGSIAIDGVSLTIAELFEASFSVALIGHTLSHTALSKLSNGDSVNIEFDILGKYILRSSKSGGSGITMDWIHEQGF